MKRLSLIAFLFAVAALGTVPAAAQETPSHPGTPQREKFAACAHEATGLKGEERRKFMSDCLKKHPTQAANAEVVGESDDGRLAPCNAEADRRKLHGDEREAFLGSCLRG